MRRKFALWFFLNIDYYVGVAGTDYSVYAGVPDTSFDCNLQEFPGIYSDTEAECQVTSAVKRESDSTPFWKLFTPIL